MNMRAIADDPAHGSRRLGAGSPAGHDMERSAGSARKVQGIARQSFRRGDVELVLRRRSADQNGDIDVRPNSGGAAMAARSATA